MPGIKGFFIVALRGGLHGGAWGDGLRGGWVGAGWVGEWWAKTRKGRVGLEGGRLEAEPLAKH